MQQQHILQTIKPLFGFGDRAGQRQPPPADDERTDGSKMLGASSGPPCLALSSFSLFLLQYFTIRASKSRSFREKGLIADSDPTHSGRFKSTDPTAAEQNVRSKRVSIRMERQASKRRCVYAFGFSVCLKRKDDTKMNIF